MSQWKVREKKQKLASHTVALYMSQIVDTKCPSRCAVIGKCTFVKME